MPGSRAAPVLAALALAAGCGGDDERSIADIKACLEEETGEQVTGGAFTPAPDDDDAPDRGELITRGAFIAFYSSAERADELAGGVRDNAEESGTEVERYDDITVVYLPGADREPIEGCLD